MKRLCLLFVAVIVLTIVFPVFALAEDECFSKNVMDKVRCTNRDSDIERIFDDRDGSSVKGYHTFFRKPGPPIRLRVGYLPSKQLNYLYWKPVPGAVSYNVYWGTDRHVTKKSEYGGDTQGMTAFSHPGVVNNRRYYYRVSSVMASGKESRLSKVVSARVMDDFVVYFPDPTLEAEIKEAINRPELDEIMYSDLQGVLLFRSDSPDMYDLEGLQYCSNLRLLVSNNNQVRDVHPLAYLAKLEELNLADNQISDIRPLAGLVDLLELYLGRNQISDIRPLAGLVNLQVLCLGNNQIREVGIIPNWEGLVLLDLMYNQMSDIRWISLIDNRYRGFSFINLAGNQISDIAPIVNNSILSRESYLNIEDNPLNEISCSVYVPQLIEWQVDVVHDCL